MTEGAGFEPAVLKDTGRCISSATHSTTLPILKKYYKFPVSNLKLKYSDFNQNPNF